jgi:hypothetical protein
MSTRINPSLYQNFLDVSIILTGLNPMEANKPLVEADPIGCS